MSNENDSSNLPYNKNVSYFLRERAMEVPSKLAVVGQKKGLLQAILSWSRRHESYTFLELEKRSNLYAQALLSLGIERGVKTLVFFKPGPDFACFIYALFKIGGIAIFIDPGMGIDALLKCIA